MLDNEYLMTKLANEQIRQYHDEAEKVRMGKLAKAARACRNSYARMASIISKRWPPKLNFVRGHEKIQAPAC